jgi:hypothetical protein
MKYIKHKFLVISILVAFSVCGKNNYSGKILDVNAGEIEYHIMTSSQFTIDSANKWELSKVESKILTLDPSELGYFCSFSFSNNSNNSNLAIQCPITTLDEMRFFVKKGNEYWCNL